MSVTAARRAMLAVLLVVCLGVPSRANASSRHDATEAGIVRALNNARASYGLPTLRTSRGLARAADAHSETMRRTNTLDHGDFFSARPALRQHAARSGENLAWMTGCDASVIVSMWLNSGPHRKIMLSNVVPADRGGQQRVGGVLRDRGLRQRSLASSSRRPARALGSCAPCGARSSIPSRRRWVARSSARSICWPSRRPPTWRRIPIARGCSSTRA